MRTDTGCLQIFVMKDGKFLESLTVFPNLTTWLDVGENNKSPVHVFPDNALHRVWYKEVCRDCGWESQPSENIPVGFGGTLDCPECRKAKRNGPFIEGCYGNVDSVQLDWETKQPMKKNEEH